MNQRPVSASQDEEQQKRQKDDKNTAEMRQLDGETNRARCWKINQGWPGAGMMKSSTP